MHARHADVRAKVSLVEADYEPEHCHVFEWESGIRRMHDALWDDSNEANPFRHNPLWQSYIWALVLLMGWNMLRASTAGEHVRIPLPCPLHHPAGAQGLSPVPPLACSWPAERAGSDLR